MDSTVMAALITAGASLVVSAATGFYFNNALEGTRAGIAENIAELKARLSKDVAEFELMIKQQAELRNRRLHALEELHNGASIGHSAAGSLLANADIHPGREDELFNRTAAALQQFSTFFGQLKESERNASLTRQDVEKASKVQAAIMKMFFSLDLNDSGKEEYKGKLRNCHEAVDTAYKDFKVYYETLRDRQHTPPIE